MKKRNSVIVILLILIILAVGIVIYFGIHSDNIEYIDPKVEADYMKINDEEFPTFDIDVKYTSKWNGKDEEGNECMIHYYDPEEFDEDVAASVEDVLINYFNYFELSNENFLDEKKLVAHANEPENILVISIHRDDKTAYVKYAVCKTSSINLEELVEYEGFLEEEP